MKEASRTWLVESTLRTLAWYLKSVILTLVEMVHALLIKHVREDILPDTNISEDFMGRTYTVWSGCTLCPLLNPMAHPNSNQAGFFTKSLVRLQLFCLLFCIKIYRLSVSSIVRVVSELDIGETFFWGRGVGGWKFSFCFHCFHDKKPMKTLTEMSLISTIETDTIFAMRRFLCYFQCLFIIKFSGSECFY